MDRPENTADVVVVLSFRDRVSLDELRSVIAQRLLAFPRFRQRVVHAGPLREAAWEDDPDFSADRHLVKHRIGAGHAALQDFASAVATERLDFEHPLWRIHLVDGAGRGSALVAKIHHCVADGFALVAVLLSLADEPPRAATRPHRPAALRALPLVEHPRASIRAALRDPARALEVVAEGGAFAGSLARMAALWPDPATRLRRTLTGQRRVAWSRPLPLGGIRAAGRAHGATVNDVLLAALAGALRGWLAAAGGRPGATDVRALVPVNLRPLGAPAELGNAFGLVFLDLPLRAATPDARLAALRERMLALKRRPDAAVTFGLLGLLGRLPVALEQAVNAFFTRKASLVVTNVPGPREHLHLAGHRIEDAMFWVPHPASLGLGISILSYAGAVRVGVRADAAVLADPGELVARFEAELAALQVAPSPERSAPPRTAPGTEAPTRRRAARPAPRKRRR
jgi:diacylglycerol O-acyltransferase / wax synthase